MVVVASAATDSVNPPEPDTQTLTTGFTKASYDTYCGWREAPYKFGLVRGDGFTLYQNHTKSMSKGASAYGFSVTSTTSRSTSRQQRIWAGNQSISDQVFGYESPGQGMKVFYSY